MDQTVNPFKNGSSTAFWMGVPPNYIGSDGYTITDTTTGNVYQKVAGVWSQVYAGLTGAAKGAAFSDGVASSSLTGTTNSTVLKSITVPALQVNSHLRIYYAWKMNNSVNNRVISFSLAGVDLGIADIRASADWADGEIHIQNMNSVSSQLVSAQGIGSHTGQPLALAVNTGVATQLNVIGLLGNVADSLQLVVCAVQVINP